nr:MAG TPA: P-loop Nucleotide Kinase3 [Caudoviricetes sp.]
MSYIICGYKGVGKSTYAHNYSYSKSIKFKSRLPQCNHWPRIIYNFEELDKEDMILRGLEKVYNEKDDSVIILPLTDEVVDTLSKYEYPFATIFPDLRMKERWENRVSPIAFSNFEEDCMKWKKDKRATVQFIIKDPYETGMTGRMVDSIILMMDKKLDKRKENE